MRVLPVRCHLHGILLLDEATTREENHRIACEGHMLRCDTRETALVKTTKYLPKTRRGLTDAEYFNIFGTRAA
jgi:hypothetical protein